MGDPKKHLSAGTVAPVCSHNALLDPFELEVAMGLEHTHVLQAVVVSCIWQNSGAAGGVSINRCTQLVRRKGLLGLLLE